ncbi:MAG: hypothetical protein WD875_04970 [Pirellulales bacterium]
MNRHFFRNRCRIVYLLPLVLFVAGGADCHSRRSWQWPWSAATPPPSVLSTNPSLDEIVRAVNGNSSLVQSMSTNYATLSPQGAPSLRAALFIERPGRFRVRGTHALSGPELDLGSNDEMFWLWIKRSEPPALYFARHSQAATSGFRRLMPLSPQQLVEAFGIATFDPQSAHQGPFPQGQGRLAVRSTIVGPEGLLTKTTVVDARSAWVVEQQLHNAAGQLLATVKTSDHKLDAMSRAWLPHTIELAIPSGNLSMTLSVERWDVNVPPPTDAFVKPEQPGFPNVDVSDPRNLPQSAPLAANSPSGMNATNAPMGDGVRMAAAGPSLRSESLGRSRYGERPIAPPDAGWQAADDDPRR